MVLWMMKDGGRAEFSLEAFEGFVAAGIPEQGLGLPAEQGGKRGCEQTETLDETVIEIGESMEFLNRLGSRPFSEFPWDSVDDTNCSTELPHLTPIWFLENGIWARGIPGWYPQLVPPVPKIVSPHAGHRSWASSGGLKHHKPTS